MKTIAKSIYALVALSLCCFEVRAQEVGFVSAAVMDVDKTSRTGTLVFSVTDNNGKPIDLFDKTYGSFPERVSPIGGTFGRIEMFAYLCSNDFPTPPGSVCRWVPMTVKRYPISTGVIPGRDIPNVFRVMFNAEASEVGDQDLITPGKSVPILVQAKIIQTGAVIVGGGTQTLSEREVVLVWRVPQN